MFVIGFPEIPLFITVFPNSNGYLAIIRLCSDKNSYVDIGVLHAHIDYINYGIHVQLWVWIRCVFSIWGHFPSINGYGSIPIVIPFLVGWTSINPSYFGVNKRYQGFDPSPHQYLLSIQASSASGHCCCSELNWLSRSCQRSTFRTDCFRDSPYIGLRYGRYPLVI